MISGIGVCNFLSVRFTPFCKVCRYQCIISANLFPHLTIGFPNKRTTVIIPFLHSLWLTVFPFCSNHFRKADRFYFLRRHNRNRTSYFGFSKRSCDHCISFFLTGNMTIFCNLRHFWIRGTPNRFLRSSFDFQLNFSPLCLHHSLLRNGNILNIHFQFEFFSIDGQRQCCLSVIIKTEFDPILFQSAIYINTGITGLNGKI